MVIYSFGGVIQIAEYWVKYAIAYVPDSKDNQTDVD